MNETIEQAMKLAEALGKKHNQKVLVLFVDEPINFEMFKTMPGSHDMPIVVCIGSLGIPNVAIDIDDVKPSHEDINQIIGKISLKPRSLFNKANPIPPNYKKAHDR